MALSHVIASDLNKIFLAQTDCSVEMMLRQAR